VDVGGGGGLSDGCITNVDPLLGSRIATTPEQFYVNVHTTEFPDGALRGQIEVSS
jgi:hypothetical protein